MLEFRLPDVGEGLATAEILAWQVAEGDHVREHQDLVEVQTDKATVVIPAPATGIVTRLCAAEGDTLDVGDVLAVIEPDGNGARAPQRPDRAAETPERPPEAPRVAARPLAAPATRRLAGELGIALEEVAGTGPE